MHDDMIDEMDLVAFVDGEVDVVRQFRIETWLSEHPEAAARVMKDFSERTALKLAIRELETSPSPALISLISAAQPPAPFASSGRRYLAMAAALVCGLMLGVGTDVYYDPSMVPDPGYLDDAIQSHEASLVRTSMPARPNLPWIRPADIRTAIRIRLPDMPATWRLVDVQVFPSDEGPSAQLLIDTIDHGRISLFSSRTGGDDTFEPMIARRYGETMAFWEIDGQSFVLMGDVSRADLHDLATELADSRLM